MKLSNQGVNFSFKSGRIFIDGMEITKIEVQIKQIVADVKREINLYIMFSQNDLWVLKKE